MDGRSPVESRTGACRCSGGASRAKIVEMSEGVEAVRSPPERELPASVFIASLFGFAKAAFLGFMGIIGIVAWDSVTDPWGYGDRHLYRHAE